MAPGRSMFRSSRTTRCGRNTSTSTAVPNNRTGGDEGGSAAAEPLFVCSRPSGPQQRLVDRDEKRAQELRASRELVHEVGPLQRGLDSLAGQLAIQDFVGGGERIEVRQRQAALAAVEADGEDAVATIARFFLYRAFPEKLLDAVVDGASQREEGRRSGALHGSRVADREIRRLEQVERPAVRG